MGIDQDIRLGVQCHQSGRLDEAEAVYRRILTQHPNHPDGLHLLGVLMSQRGRQDEAADLIGQAVKLDPNQAEYHGSLGLVLASLGKLEPAIVEYNKAILLKGDLAQVHNNLGTALQALGQFDKAAACLNRAVGLRPDKADFHFNLANVLRQLKRLEESATRYRRAVELRPNWPQAHNNLGSCLQAVGKLEQAVAAYRQAVAIKPDFAPAHRNLGRALRQLNRLDEAIHHCHLALGLEPNADDFNTLGSAWRAKGDLDRAMAAYEMSLKLEPDRADALNNLAEIYKETGRLPQAIERFGRILQARPSDAAVDSNRVYALHFDPRFDSAAILREHLLWNERHAAPLRDQRRPLNPDRGADRRLRIGYVSPDLRSHVVGWNLLPLLSHHDHEKFEVFAYASLAAEDEVTRKLRAHCDAWRNIYNANDEQAAEAVRADRIDILVDLSLHMAHNRLLVFARRPAPVQVTYLGYCSTSGVETMDYRLSDAHLDPPETDLSVYVERTIRLASYWCYQPGGEAPEVGAAPAIANGYVTFGCMNSYSKIADGAILLWAKVLAAAPGSRLVIHCPDGAHRQSAADRFAAAGIDAGRLDFVGYQSWTNYLQTYNRIDIALDPLPYGGGITTCDGLWMGVPLITLSGKTAVGRGGRSLLTTIGLPELVAHSPDEYVRLAGEWERWITLRPTLRRRVAESPLMNAGQFARDVEAAYRRMWIETMGTA